MSETSARLALPLIAPGQAQKELTHNEALALLDLATQPAVGAVGAITPPTAPTIGECWLLGASPSGAWAGHGGAIAGWTAGGWRFVTPREGMAVWAGPEAGVARYVAGGWLAGVVHAAELLIDDVAVVGVQQSAIADPAGGTVTDVQARAAIAAMLAAMRNHGLIAAA